MQNLKERIRDFRIRKDTEHTQIRSRQRCIPPKEIDRIVRECDVIEEDLDCGSFLLWGKLDNERVIHIPIYPDFATGMIWVLTSYYPDDENFTAESDYRERKKYKK